MNQYFYIKLPFHVESILFSKRPEGYSPASFRADLIFHLLHSKSNICKCKNQIANFNPWKLINDLKFLLETATSGKEHIMFREPWMFFTSQFYGWFDFKSTKQQVCYIEMQNPDMEHLNLKFDQWFNIFTINCHISGKENIMFKEPWRFFTNPFKGWFDFTSTKQQVCYIEMQNPDMEHWTLKFDQWFNIFTLNCHLR
jgi:hypothetical protein